MTDIYNLPLLPTAQVGVATVIVATPDGKGGSNPPMRALLAVSSGGATGPAGPQGIQGVPGAIGVSGAVGLTGAAGVTGAASIVAGPAGPVGVTGSTGATGATGAASSVAGPAGAAGVAGATGATGTAGLTGATGAASSVAGPAGATGTAGATGLTGAAGPQGPVGPAGSGAVGSLSSAANLSDLASVTTARTNLGLAVVAVSGAYTDLSGKPTLTTGPAGPTGPTGTAGTAGATGTAGVAGATGAAGATGLTGSTGLTGATGATGAASTVPGPAGATGATGATGAAGAAGSGGLPTPTSANTVTAFAQTDLVPISQGGTTSYVTTQTLVGGKTIDQLGVGAAVTTTTLFPAVQGNSTSVSITGAQVVAFTLSQQVNYRRPKIEVSSGTAVMDGTNAGSAFVFTAAGTLSFSAITNMTTAGALYEALVIADGGIVSFGAGITTTGTTTLADGQTALVRGYTRNDGNVRVIVTTPSVAGAAAPAATMAAPTVTGLTAGGTTTVSGSFANGTPTGFTYKIDGGTAVAATTPTIGTTTYSFAITTPAAAAHSITVTGTGGNTATSAATAFTTTAAAGLIYTYTVSAPATSPVTGPNNQYVTIKKAGVVVTAANSVAGFFVHAGFGTSATVAPAYPATNGVGLIVMSEYQGTWSYGGPNYSRPIDGGTYYYWVTTSDGDAYTNGIPLVCNG